MLYTNEVRGNGTRPGARGRVPTYPAYRSGWLRSSKQTSRTVRARKSDTKGNIPGWPLSTQRLTSRKTSTRQKVLFCTLIPIPCTIIRDGIDHCFSESHKGPVLYTTQSLDRQSTSFTYQSVLDSVRLPFVIIPGRHCSSEKRGNLRAPLRMLKPRKSFRSPSSPSFRIPNRGS